MRLALTISSLRPGGAERVLSVLANAWGARGHEVTILTFDDGSEPPFYALGPGVRHRPLALAGETSGAFAAATANLRRARELRRALRAVVPDAVVSFLTRVNVLAILATRDLGIPVVVSERVHPALAPVPRVWRLAWRAIYPFADAVVAQTEAARAALGPALQRRCTVLPNPVPLDDAPPRAPGGGRRIVAMGRLEHQKGFDLLLRAFAHVAAERPDWTLTIWGEGSERAALERLSRALGVEHAVAFPGRTRGTREALREADLFVLSSRFEGFPNVLVEAMACGLPVIAADCPSGPSEIVRDGVDGWLVAPGDASALARAILVAIADPEKRARFGAAAATTVRRFGADAVVARWETLLARCVEARRARRRAR